MKPISHELAALLEPRIMRRVRKQRRRDGCWIRTVNVNPRTGYTHITRMVDGKKDYYAAHRVMYVFHYGGIPEGLEIDHLCERPACCNPRHLRAVDRRTNVLRSTRNPYAINARKTHCIHGHELPPYVPGGKRRCLRCHSIRRAAAYKRKRASA